MEQEESCNEHHEYNGPHGDVEISPAFVLISMATCLPPGDNVTRQEIWIAGIFGQETPGNYDTKSQIPQPAQFDETTY